MTDITIQKLTKAQREQIRTMYFGDYEVTDIAEKMRIEHDTVRFLVFGVDGSGSDPTCLFQLKKKMSSTSIAMFLVDKAAVLERTSGTALRILTTALGKLDVAVSSGEQELSMDDMKKLAGIVLDLDKMVRLETGQATEHVQHMGLTAAEAREFLQADPFAASVIEGEFKEVTTLPWLDKIEEKV